MSLVDVFVDTTTTIVEVITEAPPIIVERMSPVSVPDKGDVGDVLTKTGPGPYDIEFRPSAGDPDLVEVLAAHTLSGHRVVSLVQPGLVAYAQPADYLDSRKALGITRDAAEEGASVIVRRGGTMVEPGWDWAPGDIFLGEDGTLTQSVPLSGCLVAIGVALTPTSMLVDFKPVIQLT